jgi:hypothetical protein
MEHVHTQGRRVVLDFLFLDRPNISVEFREKWVPVIFLLLLSHQQSNDHARNRSVVIPVFRLCFSFLLRLPAFLDGMRWAGTIGYQCLVFRPWSK